MTRREQGFGVFEIIVLVVGVAILAAVGMVAYSNFMAAKPAADTATTADHTEMNHAPKTPTVTSTADLDKATAALDDPTFNDDGMDKIEAEASSF